MSGSWPGVFTAVIGVLLLSYGAFAIITIDSVHEFLADPSNPYAAPEDFVRAKQLLPFLYFVAVEGIGFGGLALVCAAALLWRRGWATRALLFGSAALALAAMLAIVWVPGSWDTQVAFILMPALLWWDWIRQRRGNRSAL